MKAPSSLFIFLWKMDFRGRCPCAADAASGKRRREEEEYLEILAPYRTLEWIKLLQSTISSYALIPFFF